MSTIPTELLETLAAEPTAEAALDIESIKQIMDGFDPAALLPDLGKIFGDLATVCRIAVLIGPVILLVLGVAYFFFAPKEANFYFGYRCYFGMGSIHAWRFTQKLAGILLGGLGGGLTAVMLTVSASFGSMDVMDMVWKAARCLAWQAGLVLLTTIIINTAAALRFDRKGSFRRRKPRTQEQ